MGHGFIALAALGVVLTGCQCGPCMALGPYEVFARRAYVSNADGGSTAHCPADLSIALQLTSDQGGTFTTDAGISGTCAMSAIDYRPKYECQVSLTCTSTTGPKVKWVTFAFNRPEYPYVDGFGGVGDGRGGGMSWVAKDECEAGYSWAAAP